MGGLHPTGEAIGVVEKSVPIPTTFVNSNIEVRLGRKT